MNQTRREYQPLEIGGGLSRHQRDRWLLSLPPDRRAYADAQIDDYRGLSRADLPWQPPVELALRARASSPHPRGTLGFGFWNDPFTLALGQGGAARRLPAAPQAIWFFYGSPPNHLTFVPGIPGAGWKAMSLRSPRVPALVLAAPAAAAFLLSFLPGIRRPVMKAALGTVSASESLLAAPLDEWHSYRLQWRRDSAVFWMDGENVLTAPDPPSGPLGFVAWIDNQYAVASPEKGLRFGVLPTEMGQTLEIDGLAITPLDSS